MESPGSRPVVTAGIGAAGWARSMETVPEVSWAETGVVESVKVPKVPRPATAAAVPMTAREPRTLRVVPARLLLLIGVPPAWGRDRGDPATGTTLTAQPQDQIGRASCRERV